MAMKINNKILSIPPYISASWSRIDALHMRGNILAVTLIDGEIIQIPGLDAESVNSIFQHHASYLEKESPNLLGTTTEQALTNFKGMMDQLKGESTVSFAFGPSVENLGLVMQHNLEQANAPDLPQEVLQKISMISKIIAPSDDILVSKAVDGCNCFHCQICRALNPATTLELSEAEIDVSDEDLRFQQWDIEQTADELFIVTNRLDTFEKYNVCLREPDIGCTCGAKGCEHLLAVLKS